MPIFELHMKADDVLFGNIEVENKNDFIVGSLFPDCPWAIDPSGIITETHLAKMVDSLRFPNYFEFVSKYKNALMYSDFMRGVLFHFLLDFYYNLSWFERCNGDSFNGFEIKGDNYSVKCQSIDELLDYKYGDMKRFINFNPYKITLPETISGSTRNFVAVTYYDVDFDLDMLLVRVGDFINGDVGVKPCSKALFYDKYYNDIIRKAIQRFMEIGVLYSWFPLVREGLSW